MKKIYYKLMKIQLFRYLIVGAAATLIDWGTFYVLAVELHFHYQFGLAIAFILGSLTNYIFNKIFTFECKSKQIFEQFSLQIIVSLASLLLNSGIMYAFIGILLFEKMTSRIITTLIMLFINFLLQKHITFNKKIFRQAD